MLTALVVTASLLQAGLPPIPGPNGGPISVVDVSHVGGATQILTEERPPTGGDSLFHVYGVDGQGTLQLQASLPDQTEVTNAYAIDGDRIFYRDGQYFPRILERVGSSWVPRGRLTNQPFQFSFQGLRRGMEIRGTKVIHSLSFTSALTVQDLSDLNNPVTEFTIPFTQTVGPQELALEEDLLVLAWGTVVGSFPPNFSNVSVRVFENTPASGWTELSNLQPPAGVDWSQKYLSVDLDGGRIAVANGACGATFFYEQAQGGTFAHVDTAISNRNVEFSAGVCTSTGRVRLRGDDVVLDTGIDKAGERFARTSAGWEHRETVLADRGTFTGYWFAGDYLLSTGNHGIQTHARMDQPAKIDITCPAFASPEPNFLTSDGLGTFDLLRISLRLSLTDRGDSHFLVYGFDSGMRILGPESTLCISGALRIVPIERFESSPSPAHALFQFDPIYAGLAAGATVHFQGWKRISGVPAGRTSNALAVTFAP